MDAIQAESARTGDEKTINDNVVGLSGSPGSPATGYKDGAIMAAIGKKQQLNRIFSFFPILALSTTLLSSWEAVAASFSAGLTNGGPVSLVYGMILSISGTLALAASLSEMASMCPISGAQYHWTYMFSPPRLAPFITWMQGWITIFAWQATLTSVVFLTATQIQGLVVLNYPDYGYERWHGTLLMCAMMLITFIINVWGIKLLPAIEVLGGICHVSFFIALLVPLVVLAKKSAPEFVFTQFLNEGGWKNNGISWCIGLLTVVYCFVGFDGAIHMSEEVQNSAVVIPKVIILTVIINGALAFGFLIAVLFSIGNIQKALNTSTFYPIIEIFFQATGSRKAATAMESASITIGFCAVFGILASTSRLVWSYSRDGALPFSNYFSYVNPRYHIPIRAISLTTGVVVLLSLINIGSSTALNAILSLSSLGLYISYLIPTCLLLLKRIRKEPIPYGPFTLGRYGAWINAYAIVYAIFISIFLPFPSYMPVTATNMNYAGPVFGGLLLIALGDWIFRGRKFYTGPLREVDSENRHLYSLKTTG